MNNKVSRVYLCVLHNLYREEERTGLSLVPSPRLPKGGLRQFDGNVGRLSDFIGEVAS